MLTSLTIKNYTLIENLNVDFSSGFSVITGETGAGKSMLLGALGLVLGKRADLSSLKNEEEKCVIEAVFSVEKYGLKVFFEEQDLDFENETIIRREILPSGKSRAFVNDSPVTLQQLDELGNQLMDIHSQHQTRELSEEKYQFEVLDILAENEDLLTEYSQKLSQYKKNKKALEQAQSKLSESLKEQAFEEVEGDYAGVGHTDFWTKGSTASFLNSGALNVINAEMVKALHKTNFQRDIEI